MKKLLLTLLLLSVIGCETTPYYWETEAYKEAVEDRKAMLRDGRIHIGMTDNEFIKLWGKPPDVWIDRSTSAYSVTEWWRYDLSCEPTYDRPHYHFCFENGILDFWSEN